MLNDVSWDGPAVDRDQRTLQRIADLLGCSVQDLRDGQGLGHEPGQTAELLRLWLMVPDEDTRLSVLGQLRRAAGESEIAAP